MTLWHYFLIAALAFTVMVVASALNMNWPALAASVGAVTGWSLAAYYEHRENARGRHRGQDA